MILKVVILNKKILIGLIEVSSNTHDIGKAFKVKGYDVATIVIQKNKFYPHLEYNMVIDDLNFLRKIPKIRFLSRIIISSIYFLIHFFKYDYFIYTGDVTYMPFKLDQLLLKLIGKKFAVLYAGDDIRYRPIHISIEEKKYNFFRYKGIGRKEFLKNSNFFDFIKKLYNTKYTEFLTDYIFSSRAISTLTIKPFYKIYKPLYINQDIKINKNKTVTIVHAPSDSVVKNSKFILNCLQELKSEGYDFNLELIQNKTNQEVLKILSSAHIAVDQFASLPGRFAQEAMYFECVVLGGNKQEYVQKCNEIPVIDIDMHKEDFKNKIISLLNNPKKITEFGKKGRIYIEKYHNGDMTVDNIISAFEGKSMPNQMPLCKNKEELLSYCSKWYEKIFIKLLY
jgi:hypothetical protein